LRATNEVYKIILKACSFNISDRYKSIIQISKELENIIVNKKYGEFDLEKEMNKKTQKSDDINNFINKNFKKNSKSKKNNSTFNFKKKKSANSFKSSEDEATILMMDDSKKKDENVIHFGDVVKDVSYQTVVSSTSNLKNYLSKKPFYKSKKIIIPLITISMVIVFLFLYKVEVYDNSVGIVKQDQNIILKSDVTGIIESVDYSESKIVQNEQVLLTVAVKNSQLDKLEKDLEKENSNIKIYNKELKSIEEGENLFDKEKKDEIEYYENYNSFLVNLRKKLNGSIKSNENPKQALNRLNTDLSNANLFLNSITSNQNLIEDTNSKYYKIFEDYINDSKKLSKDEVKEFKKTETKDISDDIENKVDNIVKFKESLKEHNDYYTEIVNERMEKSTENIESINEKLGNKDDFESEIHDVKSISEGDVIALKDLKKGDNINIGDTILEIIPNKLIMESELEIKDSSNLKSGKNFKFEIIDTDKKKSVESKIVDVPKSDKDKIKVELQVDKSKLGIENSLEEDLEFKIKYLKGKQSLLFNFFSK
ncbi:MAG: hypothetical protein ABF289_16585, partial [Clostridiales bacterium]